MRPRESRRPWLALDIDAELATLDRDLAHAAAAEGVPLAVHLDD